MQTIVGRHPLVPSNTVMDSSVTGVKLNCLILHIFRMSLIALKSLQVMFESGTFSVQLFNRALTHSRACFWKSCLNFGGYRRLKHELDACLNLV